MDDDERDGHSGAAALRGHDPLSRPTQSGPKGSTPTTPPWGPLSTWCAGNWNYRRCMRIPDPYPSGWHDTQPHECHITANRVLIDGVPVPGPIAPDGISVKGGGKRPNGDLETNTVTITLLVGSVEIDDEVIQHVETYLPRRPVDD
jgi:hypothetical protein